MEDNKKSEKIPLLIVMENGSSRVVNFTETEYSIADLMVKGNSHWTISNMLGVSAMVVGNLLSNKDFTDMVASKRYFCGKAEALTADFVKAQLFDRLKSGEEPSPAQLSILKMSMQVTGLTKLGSAGGKGKASMNFKITPNKGNKEEVEKALGESGSEE